MKKGTLNEMSRRKLLRMAFGAAGVSAASKLLPGQWVKPIVDAVVLPAHAQASLVLTCFKETPSATAPANAPGDELNTYANVSPPPAIGTPINYQWICNGSPIGGQSGTRLTVDASGNTGTGFGFTNPSAFGCNEGDVFGIEWSYLTATSQCLWTLTAPVNP